MTRLLEWGESISKGDDHVVEVALKISSLSMGIK